MNILPIIVKAYGLSLRLYPGSFRTEFEEQMLLDFSDMAMDAMQKGRLCFLLFCLHELVDFPTNLVRVHLKEKGLLKIPHSKLVNYGLRGAVGFGIGFAVASVAVGGVSGWLFSTLQPKFPAFSVWIFDNVHYNKATFLFWNILSLISSASRGLIFGLLFAFLAGYRTNYFKYLLAGSLGWFIPDGVSFALATSFASYEHIGAAQSFILGIMTKVFMGEFLGAISYIAETDRQKPLRLLGVGAFLYPLTVYLYIKFLFYVGLENTPWFFPALMTLIVIFAGGVFALVRRGKRTKLWAIVAGGIAYPIIDYSVFQLFYLNMHVPDNALTLAGVQGFSGVLFGLLLGLIWGYPEKSNPRQVIV